MSVKNLIWTSEINEEDWQDENGEQMSYEHACELNSMYLEDERDNLDIPTDGEIVIIADLGLWDGRRAAHKTKGHRLNNILWSETRGAYDNTWYSDGKNIRGEEIHHDGTNYYLYREMKPGKDIDDLFSKPITPHRLGYYTKSLLPRVKEVYGWT